MNIFSFGGYSCIVGHCIRLHVDCNTLYHWLDFSIEFDEAMNGIRILIELFKIQLFFSVGANVQDPWYNSESSYFIRQDHAKLTPEQIQQLEQMGEIVDGEDY